MLVTFPYATIESRKKSSRSLAIPTRLTSLTNQLIERDTIISSLEEALECFVKQADGLRRERMELEKRLYELEAKASERTPLADRSTNLQQTVSEAIADRDTAVALAEQNEKLARSLEKELVHARHENRRGGLKSHESMLLLEKHSKETQTVSESREELETKLKTSESNLAVASNELILTNDTLQERETSLRHLTISLESVDERLKAASLQCSANQMDAENLKKSLSNAQTTVNRLSKNASEQDNYIITLESERDVAEAKFRSSQQEKTLLLSAIVRSLRLEGENESLRTAKEGVAALESADGTAQTLRENLQASEVKLSLLGATHAALLVKFGDMQLNYNQMQARLNDLEEAESRCRSLEEANRSLHSTIVLTTARGHEQAEFKTTEEAIAALRHSATFWDDASSRLAAAEMGLKELDLAKISCRQLHEENDCLLNAIATATCRGPEPAECRSADEAVVALEILARYTESGERKLVAAEASLKELDLMRTSCRSLQEDIGCLFDAIANIVATGSSRAIYNSVSAAVAALNGISGSFQKASTELAAAEADLLKTGEPQRIAQAEFSQKVQELGRAERLLADSKSMNKKSTDSENLLARQLLDTDSRQKVLELEKAEVETDMRDQLLREKERIAGLEEELGDRQLEIKNLGNRLFDELMPKEAENVHNLQTSTGDSNSTVTVNGIRARMTTESDDLRESILNEEREKSTIQQHYAELFSTCEAAVAEVARLLDGVSMLEQGDDERSELLRAMALQVTVLESQVKHLQEEKAKIVADAEVFEKEERQSREMLEKTRAEIVAMEKNLRELAQKLEEKNRFIADTAKVSKAAIDLCENVSTERDVLKRAIENIKARVLNPQGSTTRDFGLLEAICCSEDGDDHIQQTLQMVDTLIFQQEQLLSEAEERNVQSDGVQREKLKLEKELSETQREVVEANCRLAEMELERSETALRAKQEFVHADGRKNLGTQERDELQRRNDEIVESVNASREINDEAAASLVKLLAETRSFGTMKSVSTNRSSKNPPVDVPHLLTNLSEQVLSGIEESRKREAQSTVALTEARQECENARVAQAKMELTLRKIEGEGANVASRLRGKEAEMRSLYKKLANANEELDRLSAELSTRTAELFEESERSEKLEAEKCVVQKRALTLTHDESAARESLAERDKELDLLQIVLEETNEQLECVLISAETLAARVKATQEASSKLEREIHASNAEREAALDDAADATRRLESAKSAKKHVETRLTEICSLKSDTTEALAYDLEVARKEFDEAAGEVVGLVRKVDAMHVAYKEEQKIDAHQRIENRKRLVEANNAVSLLTETNATTQSQVHHRNRQLEEVYTAKKHLETTVSELTSLKMETTVQMEQARREQRRVQASSEEIHSQMKVASELNDNLRSELQEARKNEKELHEKLRAVGGEMAELRAARGNLQGELSTLKSVYEHLSMDRIAADELHSVSQRHVNEEILSLTVAKGELEGELKVSSTLCAEMQTRMMELQDHVSNVSTKQGEVESALAESETQASSVVHAKHILDLERDEVAPAIDKLVLELNDLRKTCEKLDREKSESDQKLRMSEQTLDKQVSSLQEQSVVLEAEVSKQQDENKRILAEKTELEVRMAGLEAMIHDRMEEINNLSAMKLQLNEQVAALNFQLCECRQQVAVAMERKEEETSKAATMVQVAALIEEKKTLEQRLDEALKAQDVLLREKLSIESMLKLSQATIAMQNVAAIEMAESFRDLENDLTELSCQDGGFASSLSMPIDLETLTPMSTRSRGGDAFAVQDSASLKERRGNDLNERGVASAARLRQRYVEIEQSRRELLVKLDSMRRDNRDVQHLRAQRTQRIKRQQGTLKECEDDLAALKEEIRRLQAADMRTDSAMVELNAEEEERRKESALNEILRQIGSEGDEDREEVPTAVPSAMKRKSKPTVKQRSAREEASQTPPAVTKSKALRKETQLTSALSDGLERDALGILINPDTSWISRNG